MDKLIEQLTKKELLKLLYTYSNYVTSFYDDHDKGDDPVCVSEFYDCDYEV